MKALVRLMTWLSPAFPVGGFAYSHGLEYAVESGVVTGRDSTAAWISALLLDGSARVDADLFRLAYDAANEAELDRVTELAEAWRGSNELAQEAATQGLAFLAAVQAAWPRPRLESWSQNLRRDGRRPPYAVAVAVAAREAGINRKDALTAYLHAFTANLVSAAVRLVPLGQSDGLRVMAALEPLIPRAVAAALARSPDDMGAATPMLDWCSMRHETQYTRLFRS